jgi:transcription termination factor Rho
VPRASRSELEGRPLADLHQLASEAALPRYRLLRRDDLITALSGEDAPQAVATADEAPETEEPPPLEDLEGELRSGVLDLVGEGYGFVRLSGLARSGDDPYVSRTLVRKYALRRGEQVEGLVSRDEQRPRMVSIEIVEGSPASEARADPPLLDDLPARRPSRALMPRPAAISTRMVEIVSPLGKGQRALVEGPAGSGATSLLRTLARDLSGTGVHLTVALIDVRPEEVADWEGLGVRVAASPAGTPPREQVALAELTLEQSKRAAERGEDAVLMLDSITRLARAYALARGSGGDDGGMTPVAVEAIKRWFAAARDAGDGSLTLIAAARVGSPSPFEALVHESLEDTASAIVALDSDLAARGHHPAIDVGRSRTLGEEALLDDEQRRELGNMRGVMRSLDAVEAWAFLGERAREVS